MARSKGEGSVTRRKDGRWQASLQVDGRRRVVYGRTRSEAVAKLDALRTQASAAGILPNPQAHTVADAMAAFLDAKAHTVKPRTLADYRSTIDRYILPPLGKRALAKVTPDALVRLYATWQKQGKHRTALRVHRRLSQALALAVRYGWLGSNPCDRVDAPRYTAHRKDVWSQGELRRFVDGTRQNWLHPLYLVAIASGCRLGELLALTWDDVDLDGGTLSIDKSVQRIGGQRVVTEPKTRAGVRSITLPSDVLAVLVQHRATQAAHRLALGNQWPAGALVFSTAKGKPLSASTVEHALPRQCAKLGLPRVTPHGLRHLHASLLIAGGLPVTDVSKRLGHASPAITLRVYSHAIGNNDQAATEAIADALAEQGR